jgi:hypothetical protein
VELYDSKSKEELVRALIYAQVLSLVKRHALVASTGLVSDICAWVLLVDYGLDYRRP